MIAMSEGEMVWTGARELGHPFPGGNGAHLQKAISIPLFWVLVQIRIPHSRRIHIDSRAPLQRDSIRERDVFFNASSHGRFSEAGSQPRAGALRISWETLLTDTGWLQALRLFNDAIQKFHAG